MTTIGLRELRQDASEIVRRVEAGEQIGITVSGRLAAQLIPIARPQWHRPAAVAAVGGHRRHLRWATGPGLGARPRTCRPGNWRPLGGKMRAILDTSVLISTDVPTLDGELAISAAALAELHFGILVTTDATVRAQRPHRFSIVQRRFTALPVDEAVADSYGQLAAAVVAAGRLPGARVMDLLIAATAHAHSARLYTRNAGDLRGLEALVDIMTV